MSAARRGEGVTGWAAALLLAGCTTIPCAGNPGCPDGLVCDLAVRECVRVPDPCATEHGGCDPAATCTWSASGRLCACPGAYLGDGLVCTADATRLASLAVTVGTLALGPEALGFVPEQRRYAVQAPPGAEALTLLPVAAWPPRSTLRVEGQEVPSGGSVVVPLRSLSAEVVLEVRADSGETGGYTVTVVPPP